MNTVVGSDREPLTDQVDLAAFLQLPERTLEQWRRAGKGPKWVPVGRHVRYRWEDVDEWLASRAKGGEA